MSRVWLVLFMGRGIDTVVLDMWFCSWVVVSTRLSCSWVMVSTLSAPVCFSPVVCLTRLQRGGVLELHRSVRFCRVSHASRLVCKSGDCSLCIDTGFCTVFFDNMSPSSIQ